MNSESDEERYLSDIAQDDQTEDLEILSTILEDENIKVFDNRSVTGSTQHSAYTCLLSVSSSATDEYHKIETALALNKVYDEKLRRLETNLIDRLKECRKKLSDLHEAGPYEHTKRNLFHYSVSGRPYFKDSSGFSAPDNEDTVLMRKTEMYDFSLVCSIPGWTVKDKSLFMDTIHEMSIKIRKEELSSQISKLKREAKSSDNKSNTKEIVRINKEISNLNKKPLSELALPLDQDYDWEAISNKLGYRHTPQEYRGLWNLFLHPSINKSSWNKNEHQKLKMIADGLKYQNWDEIAKELNSKRTAYQCFVYYRTNLSNTFCGKKWTSEETEYLRRLIEYYREDNYIPWAKVAAAMDNRTKIQVYNKYIRLCEIRKGRFLQEEDSVLLTCVDTLGENFRKITKYLPGRSAVQIRNRYKTLKNNNVSTTWTVEEDKKLLSLVGNQDGMPCFSYLVEHFNGKDRTQLRTRYNILMRWVKSHPHLDIVYAPRRPARRLCHGKKIKNNDLNCALEKLKTRMETEIVKTKKTRISIDSPENVIDDALIAFLTTERTREGEYKEFEQAQNEHIMIDNEIVPAQNLNNTNLKKLLILLRAKLDKNKFVKSQYSQYSDLLQIKNDVSLFKVKSYSRKNVKETIQFNAAPDVFGNPLPPTFACVLPPNFDTITGCKKIIDYANSNQSFENGLKVYFRQSPVLKEQYDLFMERFHSLFLWPVALSNEPPRVPVKRYNICATSNKNVGYDAIAAVTIPAEKSLVYNPYDTPCIDLNDAEPKDNCTLTLKNDFIANDDLMFQYCSEENKKQDSIYFCRRKKSQLTQNI